MKEWIVAEKISNDFKNKFPEVYPAILQLLWNRGLDSQEKIDEFLMPDYSQDIHNPYLFKDMKKAVERIIQAIKNQEKILVYGDYDADGVCSAVLLTESLKKIGANKVDVYLPDREKEGYGLNEAAIKNIAKEKVDLIITCDCGISNKTEVDLAVDLGMEVIVTDHHCQPSELPDKALAIINPQVEGSGYPFKSLSGTGVAFKLIQGLLLDSKIELDNKDGFEKWLLDLVAVGTVADCMPLLGENRTLVKHGLIVLNKTRRVGLKKLIGAAGLDKKNNVYAAEIKQVDYGLDTYNIGFQLGPRINAAGRMDHASMAYELLTTEDETLAQKIAEDLDRANKERQRIADKIYQDSLKQIGVIDPKIKMLFAIGNHQDSWLVGLIGLIAGKLCDNYYLPTVILSETEDEIIGSGRSVPEFDITAALSHCRKFLKKYGGHKMACGFTLKNKKFLEPFKKEMAGLAAAQLKNHVFTPKICIDTQIDLEDINWDLYNEMEKFEPFGENNSRPKFLTNDLEVMNFDKVGKEGKHLRLFLQNKQLKRKKFISFFSGVEWGEKLKIGDRIDVIYEISINQWNGSQELQLKVVDLKLS